MIIIGEKLNSSIRNVAEAIEKKDEDFLRKLAQDQVAAGAEFLDVNAGVFINNEPDLLRWMVEIVQDATDVPLCIDSPSPEALARALSSVKKKPIINSLSLEKERYAQVIPLVKEYGAGIIALCMDDEGIPQDSERRIKIARRLVERLTADGVAIGDIYLDVMVQPISTDGQSGTVSLKTVAQVRRDFPEAHITCGLSNVSFEMPKRPLLNQAYAVALAAYGMDTFMINPLDKRMMSLMYAIKALLGQDYFCGDYLAAYRSGLLTT